MANFFFGRRILKRLQVNLQKYENHFLLHFFILINFYFLLLSQRQILIDTKKQFIQIFC